MVEVPVEVAGPLTAMAAITGSLAAEGQELACGGG